MLDALTSSRRTSPGSTAAKLLRHLPPVLVAMATVWLFFCAAYAELDLPAQGHLGSGAVGNAMVAESMSTHHVWFPTWSWFGDKVPDASAAYCHHPFGIYWSEALMFWVFGTHDWMVSLPAILMSTASPALFYWTFRRGLGRMSAALGAVVFTLVPMEVGMAGFHNLEVPCMFGILVHTACAERYRDKGGRLFFAGALVGAFVTAASCWVGYLYLAPILGGTLVLEFTFRRLRSRGSEAGRAARIWVWTTVVAVLSLVMWIAMYVHLKQLASWTSAATTRSSGAEALDYWHILERRSDWIYIGFQPALIALGVLAIPFLLLRIVVRRKTIELVPLALLIGPLVWYRAFNQGAEVHVFWPHQFALYIGAAVTVLSATARDVVFLALRKLDRARWQPRARIAGVVVFALIPLVLLPDAVRALAMWKDTGGRYDEKGQAFFDDEDSTFLLRSIVRPVRRKVRVAFHASFGNDNWELYWAMRKKPEKFLSPVEPVEGGGLLWLRTSGLSAENFRKLEAAGKLSRYGDVLVADSRKTGSGSEAFSISRPPGLWESFVRGAFRPAFTMTNQPDPFTTWELRNHLGHPGSAPTEAPRTPDQKRVAHNASVVAGAPTAALDASILELLDPKKRTQFGAVTLLGTRSNVGPARELELWFRCDQDVAGDHATHIWAEPYAPLPWSLVPQPKNSRGLIGVPTFPIGSWKAGHIYVIQVRLFRRLAKEHVFFEFVPQGGPQQLGHLGGPIVATDLP